MIQPKSNQLLEELFSNLLFFGKVVVPQVFTLKSPSFHHEISKNLLDDSIKRLNIIAPRDHAKSSLVAQIYVLYHIFSRYNPKAPKLDRRFVVLISKTEAAANLLLGSIKDALEYSEPLRALFGYHGKYVSRMWGTTGITLDTGDTILTRGTLQQVRGLKVVNQRPTLIVLDDPEDENNTKTAEAMEYNLRWLLQGVVFALDNVRGKLVVVGTPQHQRCMVKVLQQMKDWKTLEYKAMYEKKGQQCTIWPDKFSVVDLLAKKEALADIGRVSVFYREWLCEITGDEEQLFREEDFRYYEGTLEELNKESVLKLSTGEVIPVNVYMGIDPASSVRQTADFATIVVVAIDAKRRWYVIAYFRQRVTPMKLAEEIIRYFKKYKPVKTRIESTGYQEMLREYLREQEFIPGLEIKEQPRTSKSRRLEGLQPYFAQHRMYMLKNMNELKDELLLFPRGKHDDLLDGLYYALKNNFPPEEKKKVLDIDDELKYFLPRTEFEMSYMRS